jgi:hypothetical protein
VLAQDRPHGWFKNSFRLNNRTVIASSTQQHSIQSPS